MPFIRRKKGQVLVVHSHRNEEGKVRQKVLHRFASPEELAAAIEPGGWGSFREVMKWSHPDYRWRWDPIKERLEEELEAWRAAPAGAAVRRRQRIETLAGDLCSALSGLPPKRKRELLKRSGESLQTLQELVGALLQGETGALAPAERRRPVGEAARDEAEREFEIGMEHWWVGDRVSACRHYRRALKIDPGHTDAHNHLGIYHFDRGRLKDAEQEFDTAIESGTRELARDGVLIEWDRLRNRPYLRALANRALCHHRRSEWGEAARIHELLLTLNPRDNQGIRYLLGEDYHRLLRLDEAIELYERALDEPDVCYNLALALHQTRQEQRAGTALLRAFAANRYVPPMLLGEPWTSVEGFHGTNTAEPEWAEAYVERTGDLWRSVPDSSAFLRKWWHAKPVEEWIGELDDAVEALDDLPPGDEASEAVHRSIGLKTDTALKMIATRVDPRASDAYRPRRPFVAGLEDVDITRDGEAAVIRYVEEGVQTTHLRLGPEVGTMTDQEILDAHNRVLEAQEVLAAQHQWVAVEVPPGSPQIAYSPETRSWQTRGDVLRCEITWSSGEGTVVAIDEYALTMKELGKMLSTYEGWGMRIVMVPDDEVHIRPTIVVREPDRDPGDFV